MHKTSHLGGFFLTAFYYTLRTGTLCQTMH